MIFSGSRMKLSRFAVLSIAAATGSAVVGDPAQSKKVPLFAFAVPLFSVPHPFKQFTIL
jgi:hypothetical protein